MAVRLNQVIVITKPNDTILLDELAMTEASVCYLDGIIRKPCSIERRYNAPYMSETGFVPLAVFPDNPNEVVPDFLPMVTYSTTKDAVLVRDPSSAAVLPDDKSAAEQQTDNERRVNLVYVAETFRSVLRFYQWSDEKIYQKFTRPRFGGRTLWPLKEILVRRQRAQILSYLSACGFDNVTRHDVLKEFGSLCEALTLYLGGKSHMYGNESPGPLDALVFGFVDVIMTNDCLSDLRDLLKGYDQILRLHEKMANECFFRHRMGTERGEVDILVTRSRDASPRRS